MDFLLVQFDYTISRGKKIKKCIELNDIVFPPFKLLLSANLHFTLHSFILA